MFRLAVNSLTSHLEGGSRTHLLKYEEAPEYLKSNPYIHTGYRSDQTWKQCLLSVLQFHNETLNIWTHLLGFLIFLGLLGWDAYSYHTSISSGDFAVILSIITCYQACMILSAVYHTFSSHSREASDMCLTLDLAGIVASITASYISGIYYGFWCHPTARHTFISVVVGFILLGVVFRKFIFDESNLLARLTYFISFTISGLAPTVCYVVFNGGLGSDEVRIFFPRIIFMYLIVGLAFFFYIFKIPESCLPGRFDILGSSHQWWHVLVFACLAYWHHTGFTFAEFRLETGCPSGNEDYKLDPLVKRSYEDKFWITF